MLVCYSNNTGATQYQFLKDYTPVQSGPSNTLSIPRAAVTDSGSYVCQVTKDGVKSDMSMVQSLKVNAPGFSVEFNPYPARINRLSNEPQWLRCDVTHVFGDDSHITSIIISRRDDLANKNDTVAMVTAYSGATLKKLGEFLSVQGGVWDGNNTMEFLDIEWRESKYAKPGFYVCEVHGLNNLGHPVSLVTTTEIVAPEVSLENVVELMMSVKKDQTTMENNMTSLVNRLSELDQFQQRMSQMERTLSFIGTSFMKLQAHVHRAQDTSDDVSRGRQCICEPTKADPSESTKAESSEPTKADPGESTKAESSEPTKADSGESTKAESSEPTKADPSESTKAKSSESTKADKEGPGPNSR